MHPVAGLPVILNNSETIMAVLTRLSFRQPCFPSTYEKIDQHCATSADLSDARWGLSGRPTMMDEISVAIYRVGTIQTVSINCQRCKSIAAAEEESKNCVVALTPEMRAASSRK